MKGAYPRARTRTPGPRRGMNKLEARYAARLEAMRLAGEIAAWRYESLKLRLADKTWYTPDFEVLLNDGGLELHETKGYWQDDARVKIKVAAEAYPEIVFRVVREVRKQWVIEEVSNGREQ